MLSFLVPTLSVLKYFLDGLISLKAYCIDRNGTHVFPHSYCNNHAGINSNIQLGTQM